MMAAPYVQKMSRSLWTTMYIAQTAFTVRKKAVARGSVITIGAEFTRDKQSSCTPDKELSIVDNPK